MSYTHFTAKIYDSLRQEDNYDRESNWAHGTVVLNSTNDPYTKGATVDLDSATEDAYIEKNYILPGVVIGDINYCRIRHDRPIISLQTDFSPLTSDLTSEINIDMGSHFESWAKAIATEAGEGRNIIQITFAGSETGVAKIRDCELLQEKASDIAQPIYLATKQNITIEGYPAYPYLSIPATRERGIDPAQTTATASKIEIKLYNPSEELSKIIYHRMNDDGTMWWNERVEVFGHREGGKDRLFFGLIKDIKNDTFETNYTIATSDIFQLLKTELFTRILAKYEDKDGTEETITDIQPLLPAGFTLHEEFEDPSDPLESEKFRWLEWVGHPIDLLEHLLDFVFSNPANIVGVPYLDQTYLDYIDKQSFENIKNGLSDPLWDDITFQFREPLGDPFGFIKEQIFKMCVIFPYITNDGRLGLKRHEQPQSSVGAPVFDSDSIIRFTNKVNSMEKYTNHIRVDFSHLINKNEDRFIRTWYAIDNEALEKTRFLAPKSSPLTFQFEGINFGFSSPPSQNFVVTNVINSYFNRYAKSITNIEFETTMKEALNVKVGDYIGIESNHLIEWTGDRMGERGLIESITPDPDITANFNEGDKWAGFIPDNPLGTDYTGYEFLDTQSEEIVTESFAGTGNKSVKENHGKINEWLGYQGGY
jgi:hypothetical protein